MVVWLSLAFAFPARAADLPHPAPHARRRVAAVDDATDGFDVTDAILRVRLDPARRHVDGRATYAVARVGPGDLVLHADGPVLTELRVDGAVVPWTRVRDTVRVADVPDGARVDVAWTVDPPWRDDGGLSWGEVTYSFHEPDMARRWLVVHDVPRDKFPLRWEVTVPEDRVVAANGTLDSREEAEPGWTTWRWRIEEPVAAYLAAVHAGPYVVLDDLGTDALPVVAWALPGTEADARETFGRTIDMVAIYEDWFGPYPFTHYGTAMAPFPGGMEHTTVTTFDTRLPGSPLGELVHAHELAHHWWGDDVTLSAWGDIWLNEGFASYAEALWVEHEGGDEALADYVRGFAERYRGAVFQEGSFPVLDPDYAWGGTVYDKGALILHALRYRLGDEDFRRLLRRWEAAHRYGNADTEAFVALAEEVAGAPLDAFFDPLLREAGESRWSPGWGTSQGPDGWTVALQVTQDRPDWSMPLPVRIDLEDGTSVSFQLAVEGPSTRATRCVRARPIGVAWDPDAWMAVMPRDEAYVVAPWTDACASEGPVAEATEEPGCACATPSGAGAVGHLRGLALVVAWSLARRSRGGGGRPPPQRLPRGAA